jgi:FkbM family methyltransferase
MQFHSQCGEDRWILENLKPEVGTFCEVGAYDGVLSSNTKVFEDLGWHGLLVEADPFLAAQCLKNRKSKVWCCAAGKGEWDLFFVNHQDRGLSGLLAEGKPINVIIKPLEWILSASNFKKLGLLSIDTEGTELDVWATIGPYRPKIVIIEHQTQDKPSKKKEILEKLELDGYRCVHTTQYNLIFVTS